MATGQTKDAGWQMGARKTVGKNVEEGWDFLFSANGLKIWPDTDHSPFTRKAPGSKTKGRNAAAPEKNFGNFTKYS